MAKSTEQIILEVAREQFVKNGYAATRTEEIARQANVTKAMVHYYFRTKEKLFEEIVQQIFSKSLKQFAHAVNKEGEVWEKLERMVSAYIDLLRGEPDIPFFVMYELSQKRETFVAELQKRSEQLPDFKSFIAQIEAEVQAGNWHPMSPVQILLTILGMTVFPFIAKPIFTTVIGISDEIFSSLMEERKTFIIDFLKKALIKSP